MNKPVIAIFVAGNLATADEEKLIEQFALYPCLIVNAETYVRQESFIVDAVVGLVPDDLKHLPDPDTAIAKWKEYESGLGKNVGGNPPSKVEDSEPPKESNTSGEKLDQNGNQNNFGKNGTNGTVGGFGTPPAPPKQGEK